MQVADLEEFLINNPRFLRLIRLINRFNPIQVMNMDRMEIRHSAILSWLLDPTENHGLGDLFLKAFLSQALKGCGDSAAIGALDVLTANLSQAVVHREWRNIDILVVDDVNSWVFIIENKLDSTQHSGQLDRYASLVRNNLRLLLGTDQDAASGAKVCKLQGIYLTLDAEPPQHNDYVALDHGAIPQILQPIVNNHRSVLDQQVYDFIGFYIEVLADMTGTDSGQKEMEQLAKQLYKEHRRVIDFIVEHGSQTALDLALAEFSSEDELVHGTLLSVGETELVVQRLGKRYVSVIPKAWAESLGGFGHADAESPGYLWAGCENWRLPFPVGIWLEVKENSNKGNYTVYVAAEVGPLANSELRRALVQHLRASLQASGISRTGRKKWFGSAAESDTAKYSRFFIDSTSISEADDVPAIKLAIERSWEEVQPLVRPVNEALSEFFSNEVERRHREE